MMIWSFTKTLRNWVVAESPGEGMAARKAFNAKPDAAEDAKAFNGFISVCRAGGFKAAGSGEEDGQVRFVAADGEERRANCERRWNRTPRHGAFSSFSSSVVSVVKGAVATLGLG